MSPLAAAAPPSIAPVREQANGPPPSPTGGWGPRQSPRASPRQPAPRQTALPQSARRRATTNGRSGAPSPLARQIPPRPNGRCPRPRQALSRAAPCPPHHRPPRHRPPAPPTAAPRAQNSAHGPWGSASGSAHHAPRPRPAAPRHQASRAAIRHRAAPATPCCPRSIHRIRCRSDRRSAGARAASSRPRTRRGRPRA